MNERYENEIKRVTGVLDAHLKKAGTQYLIGDKVSYADLAWVPWYRGVFGPFLAIKDWDAEKEVPHFWKWFQSLLERPAVKKTIEREEFQYKG